MTNEELVELYQQGVTEALNSIIEQNQGIIFKFVNRFNLEGTSSVDKEDLYQQGVLGLINAAKKYDFNNPKKAQFVTYAVHWIYASIYRFVENKNTNEELSLNAASGAEDDRALIDNVLCEENQYEIIEHKIYVRQLRKELESVMDNYLTLKEKDILKLRHGWNDNSPMSLKDISDLYNITTSWTRYIEQNAYKKIRKSPWGVKKRNIF
ncbi:sigma-70 family RNA polymerase sigma factor [Clostridium sp. 19966]|uniref:sigma-70 family RNA polymerase sigma factor n=1 Tax=Clostridium sp. 19966 TaxID=2768166 RepID=UPI0028DE0C3F|nr:sigma-70 family RNA polymerase sigma factor [Clostridium sp. 19966]MDT8717816.1 sigma-70 family RNA polymerase sigma factor [Clostridium sp. 19966]